MLGVCHMQPFRSCVPLCRADVGSWRSGALPFALNSRCIAARAVLGSWTSLTKESSSAPKTAPRKRRRPFQLIPEDRGAWEQSPRAKKKIASQMVWVEEHHC